jgi:hypothetical protein
VNDLIELVGTIDQILQAQAEADLQYFLIICGRSFSLEVIDKIKTVVLDAYRGQYIISGLEHPRFVKLLRGMTSEAQGQRIHEALAPIL